MGQTMSLCGSRTRVGRSPSVSYNEQADNSDALAPFYTHVHGLKEERKIDDEAAPSDFDAAASSSYSYEPTNQQHCVIERSTDDSDDEDQPAPRMYGSTKLRRDKPCAQLSAFSSSSSLHSSPPSGSDHAYYTTDEESPLSTASSSSSLSAQASPPRTFTSSSHTITVSHTTNNVPHHRLVNSHPFTQHRIDVTQQPRSELLRIEQPRTLTTSASTSSLRYAQYMSDNSDEELLHHSRSYQQLHSAQYQQQSQQSQQQTQQISQLGRLTATHSYSSSSLSLSITRPTSNNSMPSLSSSPDSAPPAASISASSSYSSFRSLPEDSQPVVTHNAVINIRPNVSSISLATARTFRTHRRPLALESPTPSPVQHDDVEDDSPSPLHSRSLFRPTTAASGNALSATCFSGLMMDRQPVSPGSYPGTCLSILRSQRNMIAA